MAPSTTTTDSPNGSGTAKAAFPLLISGKAHPTTKSFPVHSPKTGELLHHFSSASTADADAAVAAAQKALPVWKNTLPAAKRDIFLKAAEIMAARKDELAKYVMDEAGGDAMWAGFNIHIGIDILKDVAGRISSLSGMIPVTASPGTSALVVKEPYGVILAIAPWNAPVILGIRSVVYPLAAGNTAVLKAPEFSPMVFHTFTSILLEAGLPPGALNLVAHAPADAAEVTKHLIQNPLIRKVNFTGSTGVGRIIAELCGKNLKPVLLELGGKAPAIVCEDADLTLAAKECAMGSLMYSGQICMSTERIIVHKKIAAQFEIELKKAIANFSPDSAGPMVLISKAGVAKNKKLVKDAVDKGAIVIHGKADAEDEGPGSKMRPVVVKGTTKDMDLYYTESFGPTVSLIEVETEEEALKIANDTEYGLAASVFTQDLRTGLRIAKLIDSGAVHINGMTVHDETALPHGGMKSSGYGRFGSVGLDEWVQTKTITYKD